ncbi:MAG: DUF885 domain-containing protein [Candidatus Marinimicrobia bacterium]|nr:DUF885 domain-containing protein [Candidatus Neomarinimicrobiota bacterium]
MSAYRPIFALLFSVLITGCAQKNAATELHTIFDEVWQFQLQENPLFATSVGVHIYGDRLSSVTPEDLLRRRRYWKATLDRLNQIDFESLSNSDQINYRIFKRTVVDRLAGYEFKSYLIPLNADSGFHTGLARLAKRVPLTTVKDYDNYISRLRAIPRYINEHIALMREGIETGMTVAKVVLDGYEVTIETHVVDEPKESVFYEPFETFPVAVPVEHQERLRVEGETAIMESAVEGYRTFLEFFVGEYVPNARQTIGASELPNGQAYYEQQVKHYTTLDLASAEIHRIGLQEVERIHAEMTDVIANVGFEGSFADFLTFLRTDPQFYAETPEDLLKEASYIAKRMDAMLPSLFGHLPRLPYGVAPVPEHIAPKYTTGRYVGPSEGTTEPGYYWVNTYALESRPLYNLEALTLHEAVPGHHLQNAIARELEDLPNFRRFSYLSAFGEGWGLYCEWLGLEAGFYTDPYSNFGRLTYEMWRACRLVVDTGMHAMGWSRDEAMDFLASNTALPLHEVRTETDRYISWPGQALAYKMGELKIKELRRYSEEILAQDFDVREFHDVVLGNGAVPLDVLDEQVRSWVETRRSR